MIAKEILAARASHFQRMFREPDVVYVGHRQYRDMCDVANHSMHDTEDAVDGRIQTFCGMRVVRVYDADWLHVTLRGDV